MLKTYNIIITGQVQGVGFRPYVYVLAKQFNLTGSVSNNEEGVIIYITGLEENGNSFYNTLIETPPKVSKINKHSINEIEYIKFNNFQIIPSKKNTKLNLQLTPDFAICDECKEEISDKNNRRYSYPFTTCVNCGPRWAITDTFPFERNHTSIEEFEMCDSCNKEYTNPVDRRFHSQTNSCATCGISILLTNNVGEQLKIATNTIFKKIGELLGEGNIIAIKNTSGYLLCCDATNKNTIEKLRVKKNRPKKPFAILYPSLTMLEQHLSINEKQVEALISAERPIVIIPKMNFNGELALSSLAPNLNQLGIMLPYSGVLQLLANELSMPIVATSGNLHGSPIISDNDESLTVMQKVADYFLSHNLNILNPQDDSVLKFSFKYKHEVLFRRSRGYAPNYFASNLKSSKKIMAMGGHLKSTIAYIPNDYLYISQYLGNLDNFEVYERFTETATKFIHLFEQKPTVILTDKHPGYQSTQYGKELSNQLGIKHYQIQHHKAHFAAVLGEHELLENNEPILGVIWDGTGYGDDEQIWGGEFFHYESKIMERIMYFDYFDWLAGNKMAKEPKLSLFSLSEDSMHQEISTKYSDKEIALYKKIKNKNTLKTSSVGRLFDAVASLLNICDINSYEGEAAILLENYVTNYNINDCKSYCPSLENSIIPTKVILNNLYLDVKSGRKKEIIIINFLYTLANIIIEVAKSQSIKNIAFSGGVFQNTILIDMIKDLAKNDYKLYFNRNLAPNDENISFGQIMYYLHCFKK